MAIIDRIKFDGPTDGESWLIYKYPSDKFVLGSQLIVNESQEALFFKGGKALDLFGAGTYTLKTGNLPLLNKITNIPFGGKTPFSAEVYYVNKTDKLDMGWGTSNPIPLEDPKYGLILSIRAHGQYGVSIKDSRLFLNRIIGAVQNGTVVNHLIISKFFNGVINTKVKEITAKFMINENISFLQISAYLDKLSEQFKLAIKDEFDRFGVEVVNFYVESISPPKEEYSKLKTMKEEYSLGQQIYNQRRSFDVLDKLAENESAGGIANATMGLGMGIGAIKPISDAFKGVSSNINQTEELKDKNYKICPNCNARVEDNLKFCGECGMSLEEKVICPVCGEIVKGNMKFCGMCGASLQEKKCNKCGTINPNKSKYCGNCGEVL